MAVNCFVLPGAPGAAKLIDGVAGVTAIDCSVGVDGGGVFPPEELPPPHPKKEPTQRMNAIRANFFISKYSPEGRYTRTTTTGVNLYRIILVSNAGTMREKCFLSTTKVQLMVPQ